MNIKYLGHGGGIERGLGEAFASGVHNNTGVMDKIPSSEIRCIMCCCMHVVVQSGFSKVDALQCLCY